VNLATPVAQRQKRARPFVFQGRGAPRDPPVWRSHREIPECAAFGGFGVKRLQGPVRHQDHAAPAIPQSNGLPDILLACIGPLFDNGARRAGLLFRRPGVSREKTAFYEQHSQ